LIEIFDIIFVSIMKKKIIRVQKPEI